MSDTPSTEKVTEEKSGSSQEMQRSQSVPPQQAQASATSEPEVNWPVFIISGVGILAIALWAIFAPDNAADTLAGIVAWVSKNFGWFYIVTATVAVLFMLYMPSRERGRLSSVPITPNLSSACFLGPLCSLPQVSALTCSSSR